MQILFSEIDMRVTEMIEAERQKRLLVMREKSAQG